MWLDITRDKKMLQINDSDYYDEFSKDTKERLQRIQQYVDLAIKNGDAAYQDKPGEVIIKVRLKKKDESKDK